MPPRLFAEVAVPLPIDCLLTYSIPPALQRRVAVGMRVLVPVKKRIETGYIITLSDHTDVTGLRNIIDLPDEAPIFAPDMIELCSWMADYYCCSLGEALQSAVPAGLKSHTATRYSLVADQLTTGRYTDRQRRVIAELYRRGPLTESQLAGVAGATALSNTLHALTARGVLIAERFVKDTGVSMRTETYVRLIESRIPPHDDLAALQRKAPLQAAVYLDLIHGEPEQPAVVLYKKHNATAAVIAALVKRGWVEKTEREFFRTPEYEADARSRTKLELNPQQQAAYAAITTTIEQSEFKTFLLRGITGSGKTEVYLQAIEHALSLGRNAILLVPEISLTPQTVGRLVGRFQERIAVLHSGLSKGERHDEWRRAQRGDVRIVVGARSAVFAPLSRLGIIVVDEEHDGSYKQNEVPRYHARDVAIMRAKIVGAACVLGSATPSIESYANSERGKSTRIELLHRATKAALPEVRLVDMREETRETSGQVILSRLLEREVRARVSVGEQVILLLNRRGYSPFVLCPKCGWVAQCEDCNVSYTYHSSGGFLSCHYCNGRADVPEICGKCGFQPLLFLGTGTQKVEDYLMRAFEGARVERMDADTTSGKGGHAKILGRFATGAIDILIGTQMIAKGHDYPGVTLVGVINADTSLSVPDFRAAEQTFQLLTQVAGRAGRGDRPGLVVVQTYRPKHYAIQAAATHDYDTFYRREIVERQAAGYPPLRRMANLAIECEDPLLAEKAMAALHRLVREQIVAQDLGNIEILGPSPAAVYRVKKRYRWNLGLLAKRAKPLNTLARATREVFTKSAGFAKVELKIDLDPYGAF